GGGRRGALVAAEGAARQPAFGQRNRSDPGADRALLERPGRCARRQGPRGRGARAAQPGRYGAPGPGGRPGTDGRSALSRGSRERPSRLLQPPMHAAEASPREIWDLEGSRRRLQSQGHPMTRPGHIGGLGTAFAILLRLAPPAGADIVGVVSNDLQGSGLFQPLDPKSFIQNLSNGETQPRFGDWRQINAQALVSGTVPTEGDGRFKVEFRLWDVF